MESSGQPVQTTIFAANGAARHRLVRVAIVAGFALLAAWAVALALGVMGGFGSLPMLPGANSHGSDHPASGPAHAPAVTARTAAPTVRTHRTAAVHTGRHASSGGHSVAVRPHAHATPRPVHPPKVTG